MFVMVGFCWKCESIGNIYIYIYINVTVGVCAEVMTIYSCAFIRPAKGLGCKFNPQPKTLCTILFNELWTRAMKIPKNKFYTVKSVLLDQMIFCSMSIIEKICMLWYWCISKVFLMLALKIFELVYILVNYYHMFYALLWSQVKNAQFITWFATMWASYGMMAQLIKMS